MEGGNNPKEALDFESKIKPGKRFFCVHFFVYRTFQYRFLPPVTLQNMGTKVLKRL